MNPWLKHVAEYRKEHPRASYKESLINAKKTYNRQRGGNPAIAAAVGKTADVAGKAFDLSGQIASQVQHRRDASGFYSAEGRNRALNTYNKLKHQRDNWGKPGAILKKNQIPKEFTDADLKRISGLDKFI